MGLLSSSTKKERTVAIFDIGSGSVGGAIARIPLDSNGMPTIIKGTRTEIAFRENLDFNTFLSDMLKALSNTAKILVESKVGAVDEIVCTLASPWYISETRTIKKSRSSSFVFTKRVADEMLDKEATSFNEIYNKKYGGTQNSPEVIEHHIVGVLLNGYPVKEPLGKRTRSVEMNIVMSLSPKACLDQMREIFTQTFHNKNISFSSFILSSYIAVRDKYVSPTSYFLIDIGSEITDVAIVSNDVLKASLSFPYGKNTLFRQICNNQGIQLRDAQELYGLWSTKTLEKGAKEKVEPLFNSIKETWGKALEKSIRTLPHTLHLPSTVFLTADPDIAEWFSEIICNENYIQSISGGQKCMVVSLQGPEFLNMCNFKEGFCDPFLMIEAIALMRKI
ncbi:hypothetical protein K8Q96_01455 [Candidatus Nomurabacteria bacterium]|nr:hypothetical protein [Candidatus Nomurabacteria bacterium]